MKKLLFLTLALFLAFTGYTQDDPVRDMKKAVRSLGSYNLDPMNNLDKLEEAKRLVDGAMSTDMEKSSTEYNAKGQIYLALANSDASMAALNPDTYTRKFKGASLTAFNSFQKGLELSTKNSHSKDALSGMNQLVGLVSNEGLYAFEDQEYESSYNHFKAILEIHELLKANKEKSPLDDPKELENQNFILGVAANAAGKTEEAQAIFEKLYQKDSDRVQVYDQLFNIYLANNQLDKAEDVLTKGRRKFPDEVSILFSEINFYLKQGKIDELESKLIEAIAKEPDNITLYTTLGSTYDQLFQTYGAEGNEEKAGEYFDKAKEQYSIAIAKNPSYNDALYSMGALHFNKAAYFVGEMNKLADDYSNAGMKKYDALKDKAFAQFDEALVYFMKIEKSDPNDLNVLIALKEIYARKNNLELAEEFSKRLKVVQEGGRNESSYF